MLLHRVLNIPFPAWSRTFWNDWKCSIIFPVPYNSQPLHMAPEPLNSGWCARGGEFPFYILIKVDTGGQWLSDWMTWLPSPNSVLERRHSNFSPWWCWWGEFGGFVWEAEENSNQKRNKTTRAGGFRNKTAPYLFIRGGLRGVPGVEGCARRFRAQRGGAARRRRLEHSKGRTQ